MCIDEFEEAQPSSMPLQRSWSWISAWWANHWRADAMSAVDLKKLNMNKKLYKNKKLNKNK